MYFDLTDEQKSLRDMLDAMFADRAPLSRLLDVKPGTPFDRALWQEICATGITATMVPEALGGAAADLLTLTVVAEACGMGVVPFPVVPNALAAWLLAQPGIGDVASLVPALSAGAAIGGFAVSLAPQSNDSAEPIRSLVEHGAEADIIITVESGGRLGKVSPSEPGVRVTPIDSLDTSRPLAQIEINREAITPLHADHTVGERLVDALLITHAADALGAATALHRCAVDYAKERRQYGRPIGSFQALKHQLADISVELEPARPLCWYAAHAWDTARDDARRVAAITKAHLGHVAVASARACIEAFGGIGYTWEHPAHLYLKRAMFDRSALGTPAVHRERAAALASWGRDPASRHEASAALDAH